MISEISANFRYGKIYAIIRVSITRGILGFSWIEVFGKKAKAF